MRLIYIGLTVVLAGSAWADTVTLRSGRVIQGTYLGGSARQIRIDSGTQVQTLDVGDIAKIEFTSTEASEPAPLAPRADSGKVFHPDTTSTARSGAELTARSAAELAAGTNIVVRMIDGVDSQTNSVGQTFAASIDEPVMLNGDTVIPRGADVVVKLVDSKESGKLAGRSELTLDLVSVKVNGRPVDINTQTVSRESASRGERTAKVAGGAAALGAIIGAIAGGGKGAAIGAGAGAAAGAGAEVVTKGQRVKIPSETRLTFVLDTPVRL